MKKILLLLIDGFETYEASVFIDVIGWNLIDGDKQTKLYTCGIKREVKSSFDQRMVVDYLIHEIHIEDFDALAIPGGFEEYNFYIEGYDKKIQDLIIKFNEENKTIATICVGAIIVAKAGILKGRNATTYNKKSVRQETLKSFGANVTNEPVVIDNNIITCWNPSTAIEVAFILLERMTDTNNSNYVKEIMGFK